MVKTISQKGTLYTAEEILGEAREVVLRPRIRNKYHLTETAVDRALAEARTTATLVINLSHLDIVKDDPDDNVILACALKARANYLVSYDPHLTKLREYEGIKILTPKEFMPLLQRTTT